MLVWLWRTGSACRDHTRRQLQDMQNADCNLRQGARALKGTYKEHLFMYFGIFFGPVWALMGPARALEEQEKFNKKTNIQQINSKNM